MPAYAAGDLGLQPKKKRPAPPPQPALPGNVRIAENRIYEVEQQLQLPHELRYTPTGETTTEWMTRRWTGLLSQAGWDPTRLPIPMLHDLATAGVDDRTLLAVLHAAAPLQETLLERIREQNARRAIGESMRPTFQARQQVMARRMGSRGVREEYDVPHPPSLRPWDQSIVGWDAERVKRLANPPTLPGDVRMFESKAVPFPEAIENLTEIATDPGRRRRLDAAPWILQFLTQQPQGPEGLAAAKANLRNYLSYAGAGLAQPQRDAGLALLEDGESPLGVAYMVAAWQSYDAAELRQRGLVDPATVLERARLNAEEPAREAAQLTGGLVGRSKLPLLAFDPKTDVEQARLEASGLMAAAGQGLVHPGRILDGLNWAYDHLVSAPLGTAVQMLKPINDALVIRTPNLPGRESEGPLQAGRQPGRGILEVHPEAFTRLVTPAEAWRRAQTGGLGGAVAELGGLRPGDKDYQAAAAVFDLAAGFLMDPLIAAGRIGAGVKAAKALPLADEVASQPLLRRVTKLYPEARTPEIAHSRMSRLVYQAFGRDAEELVATSRARSTFETMARESDPVVIADRYHLPPALADAIAGQRDPNRVRDLIVAGLRGSIPTYERFEIEARILKNNREIERLEGLAPQPKLTGDEPRNPHQPRIDALRRANAELTADLHAGERTALEIRAMPGDTLAGSYRQAVKRFAAGATRRGFTEQGQVSFLDALVRSGRSFEQRRLGQLDDATRTELGRQRKLGERWQGELEELYARRAAGDQSLDDTIAQQEQALDKLASTTAGIMERQGLSDTHRLWLAREKLGVSEPATRALSWAYNRFAALRSPFELHPQVGDVISVADKAQGIRVLERLGQVLDVDRRALDDAMRAYIRATGPEDTRAAVIELMRRARALHPEYTNEMMRMYRANTESLFWSADADGRDMWSARKRWMDDDMPFSQPHLDNELLSEIPLPDWRAARDLRKLSTKAILRLKQPAPLIHVDDRIAKVAAKFGISPNRLMMVTRPLEAIDRPVSTVVAEGWAKLIRAQDILLHRVWTPSVLIRGGWTTRVLGEEAFRMASAGLASAVFKPWELIGAMAGGRAARAEAKLARGEQLTRRERMALDLGGGFARFGDRPEELLTSYTRDFWQKAPTAIRVRKGTHGYTTAWHGELKQLAGSQAMRVYLNAVANNGEGAVANGITRKWLQGHPDGQRVWKQQRPIVEEVLGGTVEPTVRSVPLSQRGSREGYITLYRGRRPRGTSDPGGGMKGPRRREEHLGGSWYTSDIRYARDFASSLEELPSGYKIEAVELPLSEARQYFNEQIRLGKLRDTRAPDDPSFFTFRNRTDEEFAEHVRKLEEQREFPEFLLPENVRARARPVVEGSEREVQQQVDELLSRQEKPVIGGGDTDLMEKWVDTFRQRVADKTRGNQITVGMARDGEIRMPVVEFATYKFGGQVPTRVQHLLDEYQGHIARGEAIPHELKVELEHELGAGLITAGEGLKVHVPLSDEDVIEQILDALPDGAKPNFVKGRGFNWEDELKPASWVNAAMEFLGARPTNFASRLPAYRQMAAAEYGRLRGLGISEERATARAQRYGIEQTRNLLYELGERSALADQMTVFSRFFNAWQEVATRWFLDLPARQGAVLGQAAMAEKVDIFLDYARESGLVYQNDRDEWVTKIPGFDRLVSNIMGIPMKTEFNVRGFNMIGNLPGLNPWTLKALIELPGMKEQWDKPGPMKAALDVLAPFGPEINLGPAWLGRAWWAASKGGGPNYGAPPWEIFSSRYQRMLWDGSVVDAMRVIDAKAKKDTGQGILEKLATMPEGPEKDALFQDYLADAQSMGRHFFILRAATGALLPAQPAYYWPNNEEAQAFYDQLNKLPEGSPARRAMYDQFIQDHPELVSYLVGKSKAKPGTPRPTEAGGDEFSLRAYWRQVETGARERLAPEDWARYGAGAVDYQQIQHDYREATAAAGATAEERLRNFGKVMEAGNHRAARIERLRQQNPLWAAQFDIQIEGSRLTSGQDHLTFKEHVAADFVNDVKVITDLVNDTPLEDVVDLGELRRARRALLDKWGTDYSGIAELEGVEGEIARYFRDTMDPYFERLDGLYEQANALPRAERGPFYNQVRELRNSYQAPAGMPTPEEVLYGMADRQQQEDLKLKWASQPPGWLSDFQRQTAGLEVDDRTRAYWDAVNQSEVAVRKYIADQHWIPQQKEALDLQAAFDQWKQQVAAANGLQEEYARAQLTPFDRAVAAKAISEPYWQPVAQALQRVHQVLGQLSTSVDGTPASIDSKAGRPVFDAFAAWLDAVRGQSTELDTAFTRWGKILGDADQPLVGADLYRVFLFGSFR